MRGGDRQTGGRPAGAKNKRTLALNEALADGGIMPLDFMLRTLRSETASEADRKWAAQAAAPYLHPRLAPQERRIAIDLPDISTPEGVGASITALVSAVADGLLAPGEAQKLSSLLEARLKAIEVNELAARIAKLEERAP